MDEERLTPLSQDATLVATLAGTAMPFASSAEEQVERWVRALRLHGRVGSAMQALGIGESPLRVEYDIGGEQAPHTPPPSEDVVEQAVDSARRMAAERGADSAGTADLLTALLDVYGPVMDRALELRGSSREELLQRLSETARPVEAQG